MTIAVIIEIIELALRIAKNMTTGTSQRDVTVAYSLEQIVAKALQAYQDHTGQPLDPALILPEKPL